METAAGKQMVQGQNIHRWRSPVVCFLQSFRVPSTWTNTKERAAFPPKKGLAGRFFGMMT